MRQREPRDLARLLLEKAAHDEAAVRELLNNPTIADEILAFHAQQASEKAIKAALVLHRVRYGRTHDLGALLELAKEAGIDVPDWMAKVEALTPSGVIFRYVDFPGDTEPFDRAEAYELICRVREWARSHVESGS